MKYLDIDDQTKNDLAIFSTGGKKSVYDLYNKAITRGGQEKLEQLFLAPLADESLINQRAAVYKFFKDCSLDFPLDSETVGTLEYYLQNQDARTQLNVGGESVSQRLKDMIAVDTDQQFVSTGVQTCLRFFYRLTEFLRNSETVFSGSLYEKEYEILNELVNNSEFAGLAPYLSSKYEAKLSTTILAELDRGIRFQYQERVLELLAKVYELDVNMAIGKVARDKGFCFATAWQADRSVLELKQVFHPHVENAIGNDLMLDREHNVLFLTGANMAGKSTLMKSIGIALYLGHMGFPVAAKKLEFSVRDGLFTSINLSDNLNAGASHYYAEVLRVKTVAKELSQGRKLFVIFDELFRGTNVKDAYDGTVALTKAFCRKTDSSFIISTHIMEAGEELQQKETHITYQYLPTEMRGSVPHYTRMLKNGITADRQGMVIIQNEEILDILDAGLKRKE